MGRSLQEQLDGAEPEAWLHEAGDYIIGEIEAISTRTGDYGPYTVLTLLEDGNDTPQNVACWDTVLKNQIADLDLAIGDTIAIKDLGPKVPKGGGKPYNNYRTFKGVATTAEPATAAAGDSFPETGDI